MVNFRLGDDKDEIMTRAWGEEPPSLLIISFVLLVTQTREQRETQTRTSALRLNSGFKICLTHNICETCLLQRFYYFMSYDL